MKDFSHKIAAEYQDLFDFMKQEHDLILTIEQMNEIIYAVRKFEDSFDDKLGREIAEMSDEVEGQGDQLVCDLCKLPYTKEEIEAGHCFNCGEREFKVNYLK